MKKKSLAALALIVAWAGLAALGGSPELVNRALAAVNENLSFQSFDSVRDNPITRIFSPSNQTEPELSGLQNGERISERLSTPGETLNEESAIPDYVLYESVFRLVVTFNQHAKSQEAKGEPVTEFRNYFINEAKLTRQENDLLTQAANDHSQNLGNVDAQAEILIGQLREQHLIGSYPEDQLIQPTPELLRLQEKRNELALRYKEQLRGLFGEDRFTEFDKFIHGPFASGFRSMSLSSILNPENQGGAK